MRILLVGNRGAGKSSLLERIKKDLSYYPLLQKFSFYDLDIEIEKKYGKLETFFLDKGEKNFRKAEVKVLSEITTNTDFSFVVLGAGFDISQLQPEDYLVWVRRESDKSGRIFLNRPRLNPEASALEEYDLRRQSREIHFQNRANFIYTLPEGQVISSEIERKILNDIWNRIFNIQFKKVDMANISVAGIESLSPVHLKQKFSSTILEIRTDLWNESEILNCKNELTQFQKIYSLRNMPSQSDLNISYGEWSYLDWDIQYGPCLWKNLESEKLILSTHEENIFTGIKLLDSAMAGNANYNDQVNLKLCPLVASWEDLIAGYNWWKTNPEKRNFLPRSTDGKWNWFRLWMKGRQKLNFIRTGPVNDANSTLSVTDQPHLFSWESTVAKNNRFAAVLGDPINQSYSPAFHRDFFAKNNMSFYAINITEEEFPKALQFLRELGLYFAAVTAPLKRSAFLVCENLVEPEKSLESINTLSWNAETNSWIGHNTDLAAFQQSYAEQISNNSKNCVVWGGGGTTSIIKAALPKATYVKAREGLQKEDQSSPDILVWAAARSKETKWPPQNWRPKVVFDLNYHENSMGLEYAERHKCDYVSGYRIFELQALQQQKIWDDFL